jgi:hypothetical protein
VVERAEAGRIAFDERSQMMVAEFVHLMKE